MSKISIAGNFVFPSGISKAVVVIDLRLGLIVEIRGYVTTADLVLDDNLLIFPGFIDIHVHGREDTTAKQNHKENYLTLGLAAINGGVVAVASMPNLPIPPTTVDMYAGVLDLAQKSPIPIIPYGAITPGSRPFRLFEERVPFKAFLAESVNDLKFTSRKQADETLRFYGGEDVSLHCDDNEILAQCINEPTHERRRPTESEVQGIQFAISQHEKHKFGRLKIVHCSTREGLALIEKARMRGTRIFAEATPHHIFADQTIITDENRTLWQMNPPLRTPEDREATLEGSRTETIDVLAGDHAPHTALEKALIEQNGRLITKLEAGGKAMSGIPTLDTHASFLTWLMVEKKFSPLTIANIASRNPAVWLNEFLPKGGKTGKGYGAIEEGRIGSLTVIDPKCPTTISRNMLKTRCGWSPWEGFTFPGRVTHTIVRGVIYAH